MRNLLVKSPDIFILGADDDSPGRRFTVHVWLKE